MGAIAHFFHFSQPFIRMVKRILGEIHHISILCKHIPFKKHQNESQIQIQTLTGTI